MGDITKDLDRIEFQCPCGCGKNDISTDFVERLQDIKDYLQKCERGCKYIIVNSGCRCSRHSLAVGGYANDQILYMLLQNHQILYPTLHSK